MAYYLPSPAYYSLLRSADNRDLAADIDAVAEDLIADHRALIQLNREKPHGDNAVKIFDTVVEKTPCHREAKEQVLRFLNKVFNLETGKPDIQTMDLESGSFLEITGRILANKIFAVLKHASRNAGQYFTRVHHSKWFNQLKDQALKALTNLGPGTLVESLTNDALACILPINHQAGIFLEMHANSCVDNRKEYGSINSDPLLWMSLPENEVAFQAHEAAYRPGALAVDRRNKCFDYRSMRRLLSPDTVSQQHRQEAIDEMTSLIYRKITKRPDSNMELPADAKERIKRYLDLVFSMGIYDSEKESVMKIKRLLAYKRVAEFAKPASRSSLHRFLLDLKHHGQAKVLPDKYIGDDIEDLKQLDLQETLQKLKMANFLGLECSANKTEAHLNKSPLLGSESKKDYSDFAHVVTRALAYNLEEYVARGQLLCGEYADAIYRVPAIMQRMGHLKLDERDSTYAFRRRGAFNFKVRLPSSVKPDGAVEFDLV